MNPMQYPRFARPAFTTSGLSIIERGAKLYFADDVQPLVMQACRAHGISFDLFATRFPMSRGQLVLLLKGHDPVSRATKRVIEDFVLKGLSLSAGMTAWQSVAATAGDRL